MEFTLHNTELNVLQWLPSTDRIIAVFSLYFKGFVCALVLILIEIGSAYAQASDTADCWENTTSWSVKRLTVSLDDIFEGEGMKAKQGIAVVSGEGEKSIFLTHGYSDSNMAKISMGFKLKLKSGHSPKETQQPLIADLAESNGIIAWTLFRSTSLLLTDQDLRLLGKVELGDNYLNMVGIEAVAPNIFAVLSRSNDELAVVRVNSDYSAKVSILHLLNASNDAYDIASNGVCFIVVYRSPGQIKLGLVADLLSEKHLELKLFADQLKRPQHAEFMNNRLYVIETEARQISGFDLASQNKYEYALPVSIYRGLTMGGRNTVLLTGFIRDNYIEEGLMEEISENRTGIFKFVLENQQ